MMWQIISGARHKYQTRTNYYRDILHSNMGKTSEALEEIEKDVQRALPTHAFFHDGKEGVQRLRNVLSAFSWRNPHIGYCQGTNILGMFLTARHEHHRRCIFAVHVGRRNILDVVHRM